MENVNCNICSSHEIELVLKAKDYRFKLGSKEFNLVKCKCCSLIYINPQPTKNEIIKFYPLKRYYPSGTLITKLVSDFILRRAEKIVKKYKKHGRLLDIGCGGGDFLGKMKHNKFVLYGIDISTEACNIAKNKVGNSAEIINSELKHCSFPDNFFDVITLWHVLEHVKNPMRLLIETKRILKNDGILIIGLPNIDSIAFKIFKKYWIDLDIPRHYYHFSLLTISNLLKVTGLKINNINYFSFGLLLHPIKSLAIFLKEVIKNNFVVNIILILFFTFLMMCTILFLLLNLFKTSQCFELVCKKN